MEAPDRHDRTDDEDDDVFHHETLQAHSNDHQSSPTTIGK